MRSFLRLSVLFVIIGLLAIEPALSEISGDINWNMAENGSEWEYGSFKLTLPNNWLYAEATSDGLQQFMNLSDMTMIEVVNLNNNPESASMINQYGDRIDDLLEQILENFLHEWGVEGKITRLNTSDQFSFLSSSVEAEGMFFSINLAYDKQTMLKITCYGAEESSVSSTTEFIVGALTSDAFDSTKNTETSMEEPNIDVKDEAEISEAGNAFQYNSMTIFFPDEWKLLNSHDNSYTYHKTGDNSTVLIMTYNLNDILGNTGIDLQNFDFKMYLPLLLQNMIASTGIEAEVETVDMPATYHAVRAHVEITGVHNVAMLVMHDSDMLYLWISSNMENKSNEIANEILSYIH